MCLSLSLSYKTTASSPLTSSTALARPQPPHFGEPPPPFVYLAGESCLKGARTENPVASRPPHGPGA
jgi:hypothetical protein